MVLSPEQLQTIKHCEDWIKSQTGAVEDTARKRKKTEVV
jgi:hypothetical protein